mgnify:CR=1 FL=1
MHVRPGPIRVELDTARKIRTRNKLHYRINHWPIWIFVFFIAPGPLTFDRQANLIEMSARAHLLYDHQDYRGWDGQKLVDLSTIDFGSLLGDADFHVLEAQGRRVYGAGSDFDSAASGFLLSDAGASGFPFFA